MKVLYFAWLRDRIGVDAEEVSPPERVATVADLMTWLAERSEGHARAFADPAIVRCALDQDYATSDTALAGAAEVAFFPPVTGG